MGLMTGWAGGTRLYQLLGSRSKALEILLSCRTINSDEAMKLGLCDKIVPNDQDLLKETISWLENLIQHDQLVISSIKKSVTNENHEKMFEDEKKLFAPLWSGLASREALKKKLKFQDK